MANKHLIGKQILKLEIDSSKNAYAIQQSMSQMVWKDLLPELNKLFDKIVGNDVVISLDKIEIDIGNINSETDFKNNTEIVDRILKLLEESINVELKKSSIGRNILRFRGDNENRSFSDYNDKKYRESEQSFNNHYFKNKYLKGDKSINQNEISENNTVRPLRVHYFNSWLYWLEKGTLLPYSIQPEENWIELVLETLALDYNAIHQLEKKLKEYPLALERLVLQHSSKDLKSIVELYTGFSQVKLLDFFNELKLTFNQNKVDSGSINYREVELSMWKHTFKKVIIERKKLDSKSITQELENLSTTESEINSDNTPIESPQFFNNAGVILLHPFLNSFFKKLNLLKGSEFKNFKSQSKAVLLLHYLSTGEEKPREYEMVLPKFICEMPSNLPLDHKLTLTKKEKNEASNVLQAAINHWGALGTTSNEGLQEGFLRREGKLIKEQTGWKLYVEQKTLDILLDQLPWTLSMVKLPWMKEFLKVEWR